MWRANHREHKDFLATSNAKRTSLLLGPHKWTLHNDSKVCSVAATYTTELKLTGCSKEDFTCGDGSCIHMTQRCDGKNDCSDETDESECKAFVQSIGYNRDAAPPPLPNDKQLDLYLAIHIQEIAEISEKEGFFRCKFLITRKWFDQKVTFQNLQNHSKLNIIHPEDRSLLWKPWTVFNNIEDRSKFTETGTEALWKVIPNSNHSFALADNSFLHNAFLFEGASNMISYENAFTVEWLCDFHMEWFPFDTQSCRMEFYHEDSVRLLPELVSYSGGELPQHFLRNITMCSTIIDGKKGVIVEIILGRPIFSSFLTVNFMNFLSVPKPPFHPIGNPISKHHPTSIQILKVLLKHKLKYFSCSDHL